MRAWAGFVLLIWLALIKPVLINSHHSPNGLKKDLKKQ